MDPLPQPQKHKRRPRYSGKNPRRFEEKYKELNPEKYPETIAKVIASGKTPAGMHRPICVKEILGILEPAPGKTIVDATLGYGGHALELLSLIQPGGLLIGLDTDPIELPRTEERLRSAGYGPESLVVRHTNYAGIGKAVSALRPEGVDGIIADLGCSSMQLDTPSRGFSFKTEGPLDLRMNPNKGQKASDHLARIDARDLAEVLVQNSDEPHAEIIAAEICRRQSQAPITTTTALATAVKSALRSLPKSVQEEEKDAPVRRVFQALRIMVNDEFAALESFLNAIPYCLKTGGRVAILTFHSGEDRRVKKSFQAGLHSGLYTGISDTVMRPSASEIHDNPRASSAKLRWAVKS